MSALGLLILRLVLAILLYAFLGSVFWILWRDLRQDDRREVRERPQGRLVIIASSVPELEVGTTFSLQAVNSIGRSPTNTIAIPDRYASAQHSLLSWREGQWWLEDRNSRNGTLLNDTPISMPTIVSAGDVIGIGHTRLKLELGGPNVPTNHN